MVEVQDWEARVIALKAENDSLTSAEIAEVVDKHPGTVRKVLKRHREAAEASSNGNGRVDVDAPDVSWTTIATIVADADGVRVNPREDQEDAGGNISIGQTDVYDHLEPEDDPDHPGWDGKDEFEAEAGEAVGDMPKDPEPDPLGHEVRLRGTEQLGWDFGPNSERAAAGTLVLKSEKLDSGFFGVGDVITGTFTARVVSVTGSEKYSKASEDYEVKPQAHVAVITEVTVR